MDVFGSFALVLAFICAVYAFGGGIAAIITRHPLLIKSARQAGMATCCLIFLATFSLEYLFFSDNFSSAYVVSHSNRDLSPFYKIAALWSGQEGSLLFWSFLLAIYVFSVLLTYRNKNGELMPYVGVVLAGVQIFFLTLNNFVESPFKALASPGADGVMHLVARTDGNGLTPLLQYPEMVIHPPNLYSGYTGFTIPFAFALGALLARYPGEKWIHLTRKWTMIAWMFQSMGILLGAHWAYAVLGWGGYWGWDPVENASLLPWLSGTAFLHSVMMQEKRGMMKVWNVWLVFITFLLCILGTFLTRSGVVSSVHAFANSQIGGWFVGFMGIILLVCFGAYFKNRDYLKSENQLDSIVSRESSFLFNNLILLVACVAVLSGTLFPVFSEWFTGNRISVGAPFFNKVNIPIGLLLLFLTGVGPLLAWRKTSTESLKRNFGWPLAIGLAAGVIALVFGFRHFYSWVCLISRSESDSLAIRRFVCGIGGGPDDAQYAALRRLYRAHGDGVCLYRAGRRGVQPRCSEGHEARRCPKNRALHFGPARLRHQTGKELHRAAAARRSAPRQQTDDDALSGETAFLHHRGERHDGGDPFDATGRFVRSVRGNEPGDATAGNSCLSESAGEMDLVRRSGGGVWDAGCAVAESAGSPGALRRTATGCRCTTNGARTCSDS